MCIVKLDCSNGKPCTITLNEVTEPFVNEWNMTTNKSFTFLIDTGSNLNLINKEAVSLFKDANVYEKKDSFINIVGGDSGIEGGMRQKMGIQGNVYELNFSVIDSSATFDALKEVTGRDVHGVLGLDFLSKYCNSINFECNELTLKDK